MIQQQMFELPKHASTEKDRQRLRIEIFETASRIVELLQSMDAWQQDAAIEVAKTLLAADRYRCGEESIKKTKDAIMSQIGGISVSSQYSRGDSPDWVKEEVEG